MQRGSTDKQPRRHSQTNSLTKFRLQRTSQRKPPHPAQLTFMGFNRTLYPQPHNPQPPQPQISPIKHPPPHCTTTLHQHHATVSSVCQSPAQSPNRRKNSSIRLNFKSTTSSSQVKKAMTSGMRLTGNVVNNYSIDTKTTEKMTVENTPSEAMENYLGKYEVMNQLGRGSYGTVHLAKRKGAADGECLAIKIYQKFKVNSEPSKFRNIRKQVTILQNLNHQHIVRLVQHVQTLTKISLVLQYCGSTSLSRYIRKKHPLPLPSLQSILSQTLSALFYLHTKNIVHRDIKAQNLLIDRHGRVRLIDFGFAIVTNKDRKLSSICGTPNYMAPELLKGEEYVGEYADVWSLGVLVYYVSQGTYPFKAETVKELTGLVCRGKYTMLPETPQGIRNIITKCLNLVPKNRPSISQILSDPFFKKEEVSLQPLQPAKIQSTEKVPLDSTS